MTTNPETQRAVPRNRPLDELRRRCGIPRAVQANPAATANLGFVIAVQLPASDPGAEIAAACVAVGLVGGGTAWLMWGAGRDTRTSASSSSGRTLGTALFQLGRAGVAIAVLLLGAGTWIGLTTHSAADERRAEARASCQEDADLQHLTGSARSDFMRQCVWERSD